MLEQFRFVGRKLFEEGLVSSHGGGLSVRDGSKLILTRRDAMLSELTSDDLIEAQMEGEVPKDNAYDISIYRSIYSSSAAVAIVHAHPVYAVALSMYEEKIIPQDMDGRTTLKIVSVVRVRELSSHEEIVRFLAPALKNGYPAALVRGHGSYAIGASLLEAYKNTSILEKACKIIVVSRSLIKEEAKKEDRRPKFRSAIPPSIGVMDRSYRNRSKR